MSDAYLRGRTGGSGLSGGGGTTVAAPTSWKDSVVVATTAAGTLATAFAAGQTVDGVVLVAGWRILLKNQAAGAENGIYIVAATGAPSRASDADTGAKLVSAAVPVQQGTANADKQFNCTNDAITLGSTAIVFVSASTAGALLAANNLSDVASAATSRTNLGLGTAAVQAATAFDAAGAAAAAQSASQPVDAELTAIAGLTSAADRAPYFTGLGAAALAVLTAAGRSLIAGADIAAQKTTLGLATLASTPTAANITDATAVGRSMLTAADQAAQTLLIAPATTVLAGLLAAADKVKLNALVALATSGSATDLTAGTVPAARMPAITGDITTTAGGVASTLSANAVVTATIADAAVTLAKLANEAQATVIGRASGAGTGVPVALTSAQLSTILGLGSAALVASSTFDAAGAAAAAQAASQPLDSDLTSIAALATTSYGRALLTLANQAAFAALIPNSGNTVGRFRNEVLIDRKVITSTADIPYVCPAWTAGQYQEIIIRWKGKVTADTNIRLQMNNDAGANYIHTYWTVNNSVAGGTSPIGTLTYAEISQMSYSTLAGFSAEFEMKFNPLTDGNYRLGRGFTYYACADATGWGIQEQFRSIAYTNNAVDITYFTLTMLNAGTGLLGTLSIWGVPA